MQVIQEAVAVQQNIGIVWVSAMCDTDQGYYRNNVQLFGYLWYFG